MLKEINARLGFLVNVGLGYLTLARSAGTLSGGEAQRIKLATELSKRSTGRTIYILDEPTSGLNDVDIDKFIQVLSLLQQNRETVIIIEHNVEFIAMVSDYIIDFGIFGGEAGGKIVAQGPPEAVFDNEASSLYRLDKLTY